MMCFQKGDAVTWFASGAVKNGMIREVYAALSGVRGPGGHTEAQERAYLVDPFGGDPVVKRQAELMPA